MSNKAKRRIWPFWLLALLFAPLADCPRCTTWNFFGPWETWDVEELYRPCAICGGDRRVSIVGRWRHQDPRRSPP